MSDSTSLAESKKAHTSAYVVILIFPILSTIVVWMRIASKYLSRLFGAGTSLLAFDFRRSTYLVRKCQQPAPDRWVTAVDKWTTKADRSNR